MSITIKERLEELEQKWGGSNSAALKSCIDQAYWSRLKSGKRTNPSDLVLAKLGLVKVIMYEQVNTEGK